MRIGLTRQSRTRLMIEFISSALKYNVIRVTCIGRTFIALSWRLHALAMRHLMQEC